MCVTIASAQTAPQPSPTTRASALADEADPTTHATALACLKEKCPGIKSSASRAVAAAAVREQHVLAAH